jgi:hypothetical protein
MVSVRLAKQEHRRLADIAHEIETIRLHGSSDLLPAFEALRELIELDSVALYSVRNRTGGWRIDRWDAVGMMAEAGPMVRKLFEDEAEFPLYDNPLAPPAGHQNRVVDALAWIEKHSPGTWDRSPMCERVLRHFNAHRFYQPRALLWNGALLLGWFGGMDPSPPTPRQMLILSMLVEPMRRRLAAEESLRETPYLRAALDIALARIGSPAFVVTSRGTIRESNDAGRALLARDAGLTTSRERVCVRRRVVGGPLTLAATIQPLVVLDDARTIGERIVPGPQIAMVEAVAAQHQQRRTVTNGLVKELDAVHRSNRHRATTLRAALGSDQVARRALLGTDPTRHRRRRTRRGRERSTTS